MFHVGVFLFVYIYTRGPQRYIAMAHIVNRLAMDFNGAPGVFPLWYMYLMVQSPVFIMYYMCDDVRRGKTYITLERGEFDELARKVECGANSTATNPSVLWYTRIYEGPFLAYVHTSHHIYKSCVACCVAQAH